MFTFGLVPSGVTTAANQISLMHTGALAKSLMPVALSKTTLYFIRAWDGINTRAL